MALLLYRSGGDGPRPFGPRWCELPHQYHDRNYDDDDHNSAGQELYHAILLFSWTFLFALLVYACFEDIDMGKPTFLKAPEITGDCAWARAIRRWLP